MKYLYRGTEYIASVYDEIEDNVINEVYPDTVVYNQKFENPIMENGKLREKSQEEIYKEKKYVVTFENDYLVNYDLYNDQILTNNQMLVEYNSINLEDLTYYKVKDNTIILDVEKKERETKIKKIKELYEIIDKIKNDTVDNGFIFKDKLKQKLRDKDIVQANAVLNAFKTARELGQPLTSIDWQFDNLKTNVYEYVTLSEQEFNLLYIKGMQYKQACFKAEELTRNQIDNLTLEQLEKVQIEAIYKQVLEQVLKSLQF